MKTNAGNDQQALSMAAMAATDSGTATGTAATTMTDTGKAWTTNAWTGHIVTAPSVFGVVLSNTATVLTIDRWNSYATPGGAAGTTPTTPAYQIVPGGAAAAWMALTANATAAAATDTTLTAEIATAGGGLIRALAAYAHTAAANTYTLTKTFTVNGSDVIPVTVAKIGVFNAQNAGLMAFETLLSATATLAAVGDNVTVTDTITM